MKRHLLGVVFCALSPLVAQAEDDPAPPPASATIPDMYKPSETGGLATIDNIGRPNGISAARLTNSGIEVPENYSGSPNSSICTNCDESGFTNFDLTAAKSPETQNYVSSPFANFREAIVSKKFAQDYYSKEMANSELALTTATWAMVEPAFFSAMNAAGSTALALSQNRYLADEAIRRSFASNKRFGDVLQESYDGCIAFFAPKEGYYKAQEKCFGNWGQKDLSATIGNDTGASTESDVLLFTQHPSHPSYDAKTKAVTIFNSDQDNGTKNDSTIKLTHLIFMPALVGATQAEYKTYLSNLVTSWKSLFGDVVYSIGDKEINSNVASMFKLKQQREPATFQYPSIGPAAAPDSVAKLNQAMKDGKVSPFKGYMIYRSDAVYYNLVRMVYKRCLYKPTSKSFWTLLPKGTAVTTANGVTVEEISALSTRNFTFNKIIGDGLFDLFKTTLAGPLKEEHCAMLNVTDANSPSSLKTLNDETASREVKDLTPVLHFYYRFAEAIAASQINEMLNEMRKYVENVTGGSFELKAREYALQLIAENAGSEWNYEFAKQRITEDMTTMVATLDQYLADYNARKDKAK